METTMDFNRVAYINKEEISRLEFVHEDVLTTTDQRAARQKELNNAMILGNGDKSKSKITFATSEGLKKVETTVWAVDEDEVVLKYGFFIPVHAIWKIDLV